MLMLLTQSIANASFGIYFPRFVGTIYELLSAPVSFFEIVLGYVGAAATKSIILGLIILATAGLFVPLRIAHPVWMLAFLVLTAVTFSLFGFIIGIWADGFEKLQVIPLLVITPLTFLGGTFYSISVLPPAWQTVTLFNPLVYLISGFRWSFFEVADVSVERQPRHDAAVPRPVPGDRVVDFPHGVQAEELRKRGHAIVGATLVVALLRSRSSRGAAAGAHIVFRAAGRSAARLSTGLQLLRRYPASAGTWRRCCVAWVLVPRLDSVAAPRLRLARMLSRTAEYGCFDFVNCRAPQGAAIGPVAPTA